MDGGWGMADGGERRCDEGLSLVNGKLKYAFGTGIGNQVSDNARTSDIRHTAISHLPSAIC